MNVNSINNQINFGWKSATYETHAFITEKAIDTVKSNNKEIGDVFDAKTISILKEYSQKPDFDERSWLRDNHYYNVKNGRTIFYRKQTALKHFIDHAQKALELYKTKQFEPAMQELGRACHFLEDLSQPDHVITTNPIQAWFRRKNHQAFEIYAGLNQKSFNYSKKIKIDTDPQADFTTFIKNLALKTANKAALYKKDIDSKDHVKWNLVAQKCLNNSQLVVSKFLTGFINEANIDNN